MYASSASVGGGQQGVGSILGVVGFEVREVTGKEGQCGT